MNKSSIKLLCIRQRSNLILIYGERRQYKITCHLSFKIIGNKTYPINCLIYNYTYKIPLLRC